MRIGDFRASYRHDDMSVRTVNVEPGDATVRKSKARGRLATPDASGQTYHPCGRHGDS